jgi:hypothetical protein
MIGLIRPFLVMVAVVQLAFAVAFFVQAPFAVNLWPFPGTTPLSFIFISSIFASAGAATLWALWSKRNGAFTGIFIDYVAILLPVGVFSLLLSREAPQYANYGILCLAGAAFGAALLVWSLRYPITDPIPMPNPVRWSFVVFIGALLIVGVRMVLAVPNVIPWRVSPELSVVIGWMYLGAAAYFAYALLRPSWTNATGQLVGFLAYDVVLIGPFLTRLPTVPAEQLVSQVIYTGVVIYSGLLALYYLAVNPRTRLLGARPLVAAPDPTRPAPVGPEPVG